MTETLLEVEGLKKYFKVEMSLLKQETLKAVDGISFKLLKGECFGLVGESGCGKSTAGRTLLQLLEPTEGRVVFDGKTLFDKAQSIKLPKKELLKLRKEMQIIFQDPFASLDPRMNVGQIVAEGLIKHKICHKKEALISAGEILEQCGLSKEVLSRYPHEFSGGQRQRIGIARALALGPKLIVADEPIAALDVSIQAQILNLMVDLKRQLGLTYLFISHDLQVVRYFCDRVAVMYLGHIVEMGTSEALFSQPLHPYTRSLLASIPKEHPALKKERFLLEGEMPSPVHPPAGCIFHTRCPYKDKGCEQRGPSLEEAEKGHFIACHKWQDLSC